MHLLAATLLLTAAVSLVDAAPSHLGTKGSGGKTVPKLDLSGIKLGSNNTSEPTPSSSLSSSLRNSQDTLASPQGNGTPYNGTPYEGTPYNGTPYEGTPYNGTPYEGTPDSSPREPEPEPPAYCDAKVPTVEDASKAAAEAAGAKLAAVIFSHRHGDRVPINTSFVPFLNLKAQGGGGTTQRGAEHLKTMGQELKAYLGQYGFTVSKDTVDLFATEQLRAQYSAKVVLKAMGIEGVEPMVPIKDQKRPGLDFVVVPELNCKASKACTQQLEATKEYERLEESWKTTKTGISEAGLLTVSDWMPRPWLKDLDITMARMCNGFTHGLDLRYNALMGQGMCMYEQDLNFLYRSKTPDNLAKLAARKAQLEGSLVLNRIAEVVRAVVAGDPLLKKNFVQYSGHETTLTPLLALLGINRVEWTPYRSNLLVEVWTVPAGKQLPFAPAASSTGADIKCEDMKSVAEYEEKKKTLSAGQTASPKTSPKASPKTSPKASPKTSPKASPKTAAKSQSGGVFVRILYNGQPLVSDAECNFGSGCSAQDFEAFLKKQQMIPKDQLEAACALETCLA